MDVVFKKEIGATMSNVYEYAIKELCAKYSPEELADQVIRYRDSYFTYQKDNNELRKENESLRYLIAKCNLEETEKTEPDVDVEVYSGEDGYLWVDVYVNKKNNRTLHNRC